MDKVDCKIFIIDDEEEILQSLLLLLNSNGYKVEIFHNIDQFLEAENYKGAGCIRLMYFGGKLT
jgi:FixJ family two-component response regulator